MLETEPSGDNNLVLVVAFAVGGSCIVVFGILAVCFMKRFGKPEFVKDQPIRKRVIVMRQNILYPESYKDPNSFSSMAPLVPHVKIEGVRSRLSSELTAGSEYDIPLDKEWEFPREK